ncbi:unnamed protein product, partial [marine sediment metagenome]
YLPNKWEDVTGRHSGTSSLYAVEKGKGPLLCKLHGSLNWFSAGPEDISVESGLSGVGKDRRSYVGRTGLPLIAKTDYFLDKVPLIIPPTLFKLQVDYRFQKIWDAAGKAIKEADELVFIGFSFPQSDIYIRYFLATNLAENVRIEKIRVVDPDAGAICKELKKPGSKFGARFKDLLLPVKVRWEEAAKIGNLNVQIY